jgi:hypothetical protein
MTATRPTLRELAQSAIKIYQRHAEAADADAGFDAGEWSGPAHSERAEREVDELAESYGYTADELEIELSCLCHEDDE